jgi:phosphonate transport system substrate-binding protein
MTRTTAGLRSPLHRRGLLRGAGALAAVALASGRARAAEPPLRFGLTPVFLTSDLELLSALEGYLSRRLGRPVQLVQRRTYQEITALLLSGQLEAAWICGYPFVQYRDRLGLVAVPVWRGQPLYESYLIVGHERVAATLEDLEGDVHAFSDPDSNSGYLVTRALLAERGSGPDTFFRKHFFTYGHRNVVRAVASGLAGSGSVDGYVWEVMAELEPGLTGQTRILRRSEPLGFPPIASARSLIGSPAVRDLQVALLDMPADPQGAEVLRLLRLDGFVAGDGALFDGIAAKVALVRDLG